MDDADDPEEVPFGPPAVPVECQCLHCGATFSSAQIELRPDAILGGMAWCCPTPGCEAAGFGFDLLPTDPNYRDEHGGWIDLGDDADDELMFEALSDSLPPADAPDELKRPDREAERRRRLFGDDDVREDDIPF